MTEAIRTIRPGVLVSLGTTVKGNVSYYKADLEGAHIESTGEERSRWETTKIVFDPDEQDAATKVRDKARSLITGVCSRSAFGLLCPETRVSELLERIVEARVMADEFNATASLTHVAVNVIYGRIVQDDMEAVRAISAEVRDLMTDMQTGLANLDVKAVRNTCNKARSIGQMLSPDAQNRLGFAIEAARKAAKDIVKAGEQVAVEIDATLMETISRARTSFLDLDHEAEITVGVPQVERRAFEYGPDTEPDAEPVAAPQVQGRKLDFEFGQDDEDGERALTDGEYYGANSDNIPFVEQEVS